MDQFSIGQYLESDTSLQDQIDDLIFELIRVRKRNRITQVELSSKTGIPQATISRLESFKSTPTLQVIIRLANALGLTLNLNRLESGSDED